MNLNETCGNYQIKMPNPKEQYTLSKKQYISGKMRFQGLVQDVSTQTELVTEPTSISTQTEDIDENTIIESMNEMRDRFRDFEREKAQLIDTIRHLRENHILVLTRIKQRLMVKFHLLILLTNFLVNLLTNPM